MTEFKMGCVPDNRDARDRMLTARLQGDDAVLRYRTMDLTKYAPPIWNQGSLGSCTGQGTARAMMTLMNMKRKSTKRDLSRLFLYWMGRLDMGREYIYQDSGAMVRGVLKMACKYGACKESLFTENEWYQKAPSNFAWRDAITCQMIQYYRCADAHDVVKALNASLPVVIGVNIYNSFLNPVQGHIPPHRADETIQGAHCMCVLGYDIDACTLTIHNSWGSAWGDGGKCYISFEEFDSILCDAWAVTDVE
jgi:C1A family cysteine protease